MGDEATSAAGQWNIPEAGPNTVKPNFGNGNAGASGNPANAGNNGGNGNNNGSGNLGDTNKPGQIPGNESVSDTLRRRGFFEAISSIDCPMQRLAQLLAGFRQEATDRMLKLDDQAKVRIEHLESLIDAASRKIEELKVKVEKAEQYKEADDQALQQLIVEKQQQEQQLDEMQKNLTNVRIRLGEAKAGIINKSLDEAEVQVKKALNIQQTMYDGMKKMNKQKFDDRTDFLQRMKRCYEELHTLYKARYQKINRHLAVLDADGISPVTTQVLGTIGSISFAAAGFFFSTFAGAAGFGNQDILYFIFSGLIDTANVPAGMFFKILILLALILLVTVVSLGCNILLNWLKRKSAEEILSEVRFEGEVASKMEHFEASIKSNNWTALWLQFVPGILIAGLLLLGISKSARPGDIDSINASSEGLIVGTCIAMSLAGLIYLYIIKVVEPRLLLRYAAEPGTRINWIRANAELVVIIIAFLVFSVCIIAIPYAENGTASNIISVDHKTRYAILLFIAICMAGGIVFAYSIRNHGLIGTSRFLERLLEKLDKAIGYCSAPEAPDLHNNITEEHGNIVEHVLKQLTYRAAINTGSQPVHRGKTREQNFWEKLKDIIKRVRKEENITKEPIQAITNMEPWEERYFPHIVDELKAVEFEYREQKNKVQKAEDDITDHKTAKQSEHRKLGADIEVCRKNIKDYKDQIYMTMEEKAEKFQDIRDKYGIIISEFQDGFHLGMWYRENGMGPVPGYFEKCSPEPPGAQSV